MIDAVVTAGGSPQPGDPLYEFTQGKPKALIDIAGKPMIQWVLEALDEAATVHRVIIVGLQPPQLLSSRKLAAYLPDSGGLLTNILTGVEKVTELDPAVQHILTVSSDIPAIRGEMVDWVVNQSIETDADACYNLITREVMEARYPNSRRSYTRLKDMEVCGGDMNVIRSSLVTAPDSLWEKIIASRKNVFRQASLIGYDTLLLLFLGRLTLEKGVQRVTKRLHLNGRALLCPYAEVGMDVDKPHQLQLMRADLARTAAAAPSRPPAHP
jgi:molybdopterin-guanine dinucleotide biosynthesis protein A